MTQKLGPGMLKRLNKKHQQNLHKLAGNQNSITSLNKACCRHLQKLARCCVESLCIRASKWAFTVMFQVLLSSCRSTITCLKIRNSVPKQDSVPVRNLVHVSQQKDGKAYQKISVVVSTVTNMVENTYSGPTEAALAQHLKRKTPCDGGNFWMPSGLWQTSGK